MSELDWNTVFIITCTMLMVSFNAVVACSLYTSGQVVLGSVFVGLCFGWAMVGIMDCGL